MPFVLVKHKVKSYASWKPVFDAHRAARRSAGLDDMHVLRDADDPNHVIILFRTDDLARARAFTESSQLREAMKSGGVAGKPDMYFLHA